MCRDISEPKAVSSIRDTFNTVAAGYDNQSLRFFQDSAKHMATYFNPQERIHLLDVATGTGNAAITLAGYLPLAQITGVDFSPAMLAQARAKAEKHNVGNVEFIEMDMQMLEFPDNYFDAAVCAFGIFFVEDMEQQLKHIVDKVKSGGRILISCFHEGSFSPCSDMFLDRIEQYGIERPPQRWKRIDSEEKCNELFRDAKINDIRVDRKNLGYFLENTDKWWDVVWNAGHRGLVEQLPAVDVHKFRQEHMLEIEKLLTKDGIWLNLEVLHTVGVKR